MKRYTFYTLLMALLFCSCHGVGIMDDIYDDPAEAKQEGGSAEYEEKTQTVTGTIVVNASSYSQWAYVDLHALRDSIISGKTPTFTPTYLDVSLKEVPGTMNEGDDGIYFRWYDVFGKGLESNRRATEAEVLAVKDKLPADLQKNTTCYKTAKQAEPASWDLAFHYCNVRTNGGSVLQTPFTSTGETTDWSVVGSAADYATETFTPDTWNESWVWVNRSTILAGIVPCQGLYVNEMLGTWLQFTLKSMMPQWTHRSNIYILKMKDGTMAALNLVNYKGGAGGKTTGYLTINFMYPLRP